MTEHAPNKDTAAAPPGQPFKEPTVREAGEAFRRGNVRDETPRARTRLEATVDDLEFRAAQQAAKSDHLEQIVVALAQKVGWLERHRHTADGYPALPIKDLSVTPCLGLHGPQQSA